MTAGLPLKSMLSVLGFAALAMTAGSAFSQSTQYRRGYDQGYRDGVEATRPAAQNAPMTGRITIVDASYGNRSGRCDAREAVQAIAMGRRHVDVKADNGLCGDPAPNQPSKRLSVTYQCGDGTERRAGGAEGSLLPINCR